MGVHERSAASNSAGRTGPTKASAGAGRESDSDSASEGAADASVTVARVGGFFGVASCASDPPRVTRQRGACAPTHLPSWRRRMPPRSLAAGAAGPRDDGPAPFPPLAAARPGLGLALAPRRISPTPIHRDSLSASGKTCGDDIAVRTRVARTRTTRELRERRSEGGARATRPRWTDPRVACGLRRRVRLARRRSESPGSSPSIADDRDPGERVRREITVENRPLKKTSDESPPRLSSTTPTHSLPSTSSVATESMRASGAFLRPRTPSALANVDERRTLRPSPPLHRSAS